MREQRERERTERDVPEVAPAELAVPPRTQMRDGPEPPVASEQGAPSASASDLAYDDHPMLPRELLQIVAGGDEASLVQMLQGYPAIGSAILGAITRTHGQHVAKTVGAKSKPTAAPETGDHEQKPEGYDGGPIRVDPDHTSDRSKVAGFDQIARYRSPEAAMPSHVRLPPTMVKELDRLWAESNAKNKEHGGNLVRTYGGNYEFRQTHDPNDNHDTYHSDTSNVGRLDDHVAIVHTHPTDKQAPDYIGFSDVDLASIVDEEQPLNILRSGTQTYMIARTKEFEALIDKDNDPEKLSELRMAIAATWKAAYKAELAAGGGRPAATEAGVIAVCRKFHLVYYWGQGQDLHRIR